MTVFRNVNLKGEVKMIKNYLENCKEMLSVRDITELLPVGKGIIYRLIKNKEIKHLRVGNTIIVPKKYLIEYLEKSAA